MGVGPCVKLIFHLVSNVKKELLQHCYSIKKKGTWLDFDWGLLISNSLGSPGLLCYSQRCLIPAVVPSSLSGSISAGQGGGRHQGMAPGCAVQHIPASTHPALQTSNPPTITAWGRPSWAQGREEGWSLWPLDVTSHQLLWWTRKLPHVVSPTNEAGTPKLMSNKMHCFFHQNQTGGTAIMNF